MKILGGREADALPSGAFVVEMPGRAYLETDRGRVVLPLGVAACRYPRLHPSGLTVAGQGSVHQTPEHTVGSGWTVRPVTACGVSGPVIYDDAGSLHISNCSIGVQGWRYVDLVTGDLVTGDATTGPAPYGLHEWTDLGLNGETLIVGQLPTGGIGLWDGSHHRRVALGETKIIRAHRQGAAVSLAWWQQDQNAAMLEWTTVEDLRACPIVPPDPVVIPTFQKTTQTIGMGLFDDFAGPRIADLSEAITPNVRAIFWQIGTNGRSQSKALAKSIGWGALAYKDGYGLKPSQVPDGFRALVFAYPDEDLSVGASVKKVSDTLKALTDADVPCDLAVALYCQYRAPGNYALPVQKVMDTLTRVWDLGIEFNVGACWGFTKRRVSGGQVVDGVEYWPELQECYRRLQAASGDWLHFPPYATAPPPDTFWAPLGDLHV